jgi:hypothetical protein
VGGGPEHKSTIDPLLEGAGEKGQSGWLAHMQLQVYLPRSTTLQRKQGKLCTAISNLRVSQINAWRNRIIALLPGKLVLCSCNSAPFLSYRQQTAVTQQAAGSTAGIWQQTGSDIHGCAPYLLLLSPAALVTPPSHRCRKAPQRSTGTVLNLRVCLYL